MPISHNPRHRCVDNKKVERSEGVARHGSTNRDMMDHDGRIRSRHDEVNFSCNSFSIFVWHGVKPTPWGGFLHVFTWAWGSRWVPVSHGLRKMPPRNPSWKKMVQWRWAHTIGAHESELRVPCLFVHWWFIGRHCTVADLINHYQGFLLRVPKFQYWEDRPSPKQCHKKTLYSFDLIHRFWVKLYL